MAGKIPFNKSLFLLPVLILFFLCTPVSAGFIITTPQEYTLTFDVTCRFAEDCEESIIQVPLFLNAFEDGFAPYLEIKTLAIKPEPTEITVDSSGNMRAVYKDFHRRGDLKISQAALVSTRKVKLEPNKPYSGGYSYRKYLAPSTMVESSSPEIIKKAAALTKGINDPYEKARRIYAFVQTHMIYDTNWKYANKGALSALRTGRGVCDDHSALMVALLRAVGIPARTVAGYAFNYDMTHVPNGGQYILADGSRWLEKDDGKNIWSNSRHGWVEFYLNGEGWVPADPTTSPGKKQTSPDWTTFGSLNPKLDYIPDSIGETFSTSFWVRGKWPQINGLVKVKKGYQDIEGGMYLVMSNSGKSRFPVPFFLPYKTAGVVIDGDDLGLSPPAVLKSGTALVPMRPLFEALGAVVSYDGAKKSVEGFRGNTSVTLAINSTTAFVNGSPVSLGTPAQVIGGTVYVPARFVGQALGEKVSWDGTNRRIIIGSE